MNNKISIYLHGVTQEFIRQIVPLGDPLRPSYNINMLLGALAHIVSSSKGLQELDMDDLRYLVPIYKAPGIYGAAEIEKALASQHYHIAQDILTYENVTATKDLPEEKLVRRLATFSQADQFAVLFTIKAIIASEP